MTIFSANFLHIIIPSWQLTGSMHQIGSLICNKHNKQMVKMTILFLLWQPVAQYGCSTMLQPILCITDNSPTNSTLHIQVYTLYSGCSRLAGVILMSTVISDNQLTSNNYTSTQLYTRCLVIDRLTYIVLRVTCIV